MNHESAGNAQHLFTVGHSSHSLDVFLHLLQMHGVQVVVDVRSAPYSRHVPHFSKARLELVLRQHGFRYLFMGDSMGGKPDSPAFRNAAGRVDYAKIAAGGTFQKGIDRLLEGLAAGWKIVLMCAEEDPAHCHRQWLIARELELGRKVAVTHIRADGRLVPAKVLMREIPSQMELF